LESIQSSIVLPSVVIAGHPHGDDFGHGPVSVQNNDSAPGSNMIQVAAQPIPQLGYSDRSHMATMALTGTFAS